MSDAESVQLDDGEYLGIYMAKELTKRADTQGLRKTLAPHQDSGRNLERTTVYAEFTRNAAPR